MHTQTIDSKPENREASHHEQFEVLLEKVAFTEIGHSNYKQSSWQYNQQVNILPKQLILTLLDNLKQSYPELAKFFEIKAHSTFDQIAESVAMKFGLSQETTSAIKDNFVSNLINGMLGLTRAARIPAKVSQTFGDNYVESYDLNLNNGIGPILRIDVHANEFGIFAVRLRPLNYNLNHEEFLIDLKKKIARNLISIFKVEEKYYSRCDLIKSGVESELICTVSRRLSGKGASIEGFLADQRTERDFKLYNYLRDYFSEEQGKLLLEFSKKVPKESFDYVIARSGLTVVPFAYHKRENLISLTIQDGSVAILYTGINHLFAGGQSRYTLKEVDFINYAALETLGILNEARALSGKSIFNSGIEQRLSIPSVKSWLDNLSSEISKKIESK